MSSTNTENHLKAKADEYLRQHRIVELFEDLCTAVCFTQPQNIEEFLIQQLKLKQKQGNQIKKGFKTGIFGKEEINNIFTLFDLKKDGYISKAQTKEALKTLASSELQTDKIESADIPENVDQKNFLRLCQNILGLAQQ